MWLPQGIRADKPRLARFQRLLLWLSIPGAALLVGGYMLGVWLPVLLMVVAIVALDAYFIIVCEYWLSRG